MAGSTSHKRLLKELAKVGASNRQLLRFSILTPLFLQIHKDGMPPGIELIDRTDNVDGDWFLDVRVLDENPIYQGEVYRLKFRFPRMYPIGKHTLCDFTHPVHTNTIGRASRGYV